MYQPEDLVAAKRNLEMWEDRFDRYSGNNPNKYRSDIRDARQKVRIIEESLRASGAHHGI